MPKPPRQKVGGHSAADCIHSMIMYAAWLAVWTDCECMQGSKHEEQTRQRAKDLPLEARQAIIDEAMQTKDMDNSHLLAGIHERCSRCARKKTNSGGAMFLLACASSCAAPYTHADQLCWHCSPDMVQSSHDEGCTDHHIRDRSSSCSCSWPYTNSVALTPASVAISTLSPSASSNPC